MRGFLFPTRASRLPLVFLLLACLPGSRLHADSSAAATTPTDTDFLRDYAETRGFMLGRPVNATPTPDGTAVLFLRAKSGREPSQSLFEFDVATRQTRQLLAPEDALKGAAESLSPEEKARRERQRISVGGFTAFSISKDSALVLLSLSGKLYVLRRADGSVRELATGPGTVVDPKFSPDSRSVAYVRNQDVYVVDLATGKERAVTTGGTETVSHGLAEFVAQEEMARFSGFWWSPDSRRIAYQESDASGVEVWYAADPAQPGNPPERTFYPRPGKGNVKVRLGVVPVDAPDRTVWVDWDHARYEYLGKVTWSEHGPLTLTLLSRDQTNLALLTADPDTGKTGVLLTEHDDAWVNLPQDVPVWLSDEDGGGFLWASEQGGQRSLERIDPNGQTRQPPLSENIRELVGVAGGRAYVLGNSLFPVMTGLNAIELHPELVPSPHPKHKKADADAAQSTPEPQPRPAKQIGLLTQANLGDSETIYVETVQSSSSMPLSSVRYTKDQSLAGELPSISLEPPASLNCLLEFASASESRLLGPRRVLPHRTDCLAILVRPHDYGVGRGHRYPVIVDVYGGPGHQQVLEAMRPYLLDQWLADQGFIVVAIDGRGTPGRGRDWERAIAGHFGSVPLDDQVEALKLLGAKHPEMDLDRVGITGWSFGGYMSALAVLRRPDVFKAAVAGAPVTDWMDYDTCYTERYLGVPGAGRFPDAYQEGSLLTYAADLSRPLLLIHGTADDNVYFRHSLKLDEALFRAGKPAEFLPLSSFTHMVPDPVIRTRLEERIADYFHEHLGQPQPANP